MLKTEKKAFCVTYKSKSDIWCENIALADDIQQVVNYYARKSNDVHIRRANEMELEEAMHKNKPIRIF